MMKKIIKAIIIMAITASCASMKDKVIERIDNLKEKPEWATLSKTTYVKDGIVYSVGFAESDGAAKISSLIKLASHNAKTNLTKEIANSIGAVYQAVEEGTTGNDLSRYIGTEKSLVLAHEIRHEKTYYEKVLTNTAVNERELHIQMYALVGIPEGILRKLIKDSLNEQKSISNELKAKVDKQLDKLLDN